jgi:hypothetical protein
MATLPVLSWLANAASALFGSHGDVTAAAQQAGCSRQAVCDPAERVQQAVGEARLPGPGRAQLLEENARQAQGLAPLDVGLDVFPSEQPAPVTLNRVWRQVEELPLRLAVVELWRLSHGARTAVGVTRAAVQQAVWACLEPNWQATYARVKGVLGGVVRARSAVESDPQKLAQELSTPQLAA